LMRRYRYLGSLPKIGENNYYLATWRDEWVALLSFSVAVRCIGQHAKHARFAQMRPWHPETVVRPLVNAHVIVPRHVARHALRTRAHIKKDLTIGGLYGLPLLPTSKTAMPPRPRYE